MSTASTTQAARIPFLDLKAEYAHLQSLGLEELVVGTLRKAYYVEGPAVRAFEGEFAAYCGAGDSVALDSGTAALHMALLAANIGAGDEVIVPAHTFIATAAAVAMAGATPVFVDADPASWQMTAALIEGAVTPRTRAVIAVHLFGMCAPVAEIGELCRRLGLLLIEDAAQAHGARYNGQRIGSFGMMSCFSFYPAKNLGAFGDGGAITASDPKLVARLRRLRNHGRLTKYEHSEVGYNYRMDEMQGVVLGFKLKYLDGWNARRRQIAAAYREQLAALPIAMPQPVAGSEPVYHLFPISTTRRDELASFLDSRQIDSGVHYPVPLHLQPAFAHLAYRAGQLPTAERIGSTELSLPIGPFMSDDQVARVIQAVKHFFECPSR